MSPHRGARPPREDGGAQSITQLLLRMMKMRTVRSSYKMLGLRRHSGEGAAVGLLLKKPNLPLESHLESMITSMIGCARHFS
jgi:hypothetical protein